MTVKNIKIALCVLLAGILAIPLTLDASRPVPSNFQIFRSLGLNLNDALLTKLGNEIGSILTSIDLSDFVGQTFDVGGLATIRVDGINLSYGGAPTGSIDPIPPNLLRASLHFPRIKVDAYIDAGFLGSTSGNIKATVDFSSDLTPTLDDFKLGLIASNVTMNMSNLDANFGGILGTVIDLLLNNVFPDLIETFVQDEIDKLLVGIFDGSPLYDLSVFLEDFLATAPCFTTSEIDYKLANSQGYTISTKAGLFPLALKFGETFPTTFPNTLPGFTARTPNSNRPYHLGITLSDDLLNDIFLVVSKSAFMNLEIDACFLDMNGSFELNSLALIVVAPETYSLFPTPVPIKLRINPLKGPRVSMNANNEITLLLDDVEIDIIAIEDGHEFRVFTVLIDLPVKMLFSVDPVTGDLGLDLELVTDTQGNPDLSVHISDMGVLQTTTDHVVKSGLQAVLLLAWGLLPLDTFIDPILDTIENLEFFGLSPKIKEISVAGNNNDYLSLFIYLDGQIDLPFPKKKALSGKGYNVKAPAASPKGMVALGQNNSTEMLVMRAWNFEPVELSPVSVGITPVDFISNPKRGLIYVLGTSGPNGKLSTFITGDLNFNAVAGNPLSLSSGIPIQGALNMNRERLHILTRGNQIESFNLGANLPRKLNSVSVGGSGAEAITLDHHRSLLYVSLSSNNSIKVFDASSATPSLQNTIFLNNYGIGRVGQIIYNPEIDVLYIADETGQAVASLTCRAAPGSFYLLTSQSALNGITKMTIDYERDVLYLASQSNNKIQSFDTDTLAPLFTTYGSVIANAHGLSHHPSNFVYSTDPSRSNVYFLKGDNLETVIGTPLREGTNTNNAVYFTNGGTDFVRPTIGTVSNHGDTGDEIGPYVIRADDVEDDVAISECHLLYEVDARKPSVAVEMAKLDCITFLGEIPGQSGGSNIEYWLEAVDTSNNRSLSQKFSFRVIPATPTRTPTPTLTPSLTPTHSAIPSRTPTMTATPTSTPGSPRPTSTPTRTNTQPPTTPPTQRPSSTPTRTPTEGPTGTPTDTATPGPSFTETPYYSPTETATPVTPSQTPTPTPSPTPSPTETPTATPTPDVVPPLIFMAGYWDTQLESRRSGHMKVKAIIMAEDVDTLEMFYQGQPTGIFLRDRGLPPDEDMAANDHIWGCKMLFPPGAPEVSALLELRAVDTSGNFHTWPMLTVE